MQNTPGLEKELTRTTKELEGINQKLDNPNFTTRAPEQVVETQRKKAQESTNKKQVLEEQLQQISAAMQAS